MNFNSHTNIQIRLCCTQQLDSMIRRPYIRHFIEKFGMADLIKCDLLQ